MPVMCFLISVVVTDVIFDKMARGYTQVSVYKTCQRRNRADKKLWHEPAAGRGAWGGRGGEGALL